MQGIPVRGRFRVFRRRFVFLLISHKLMLSKLFYFDHSFTHIICQNQTRWSKNFKVLCGICPLQPPYLLNLLSLSSATNFTLCVTWVILQMPDFLILIGWIPFDRNSIRRRSRNVTNPTPKSRKTKRMKKRKMKLRRRRNERTHELRKELDMIEYV